MTWQPKKAVFRPHPDPTSRMCIFDGELQHEDGRVWIEPPIETVWPTAEFAANVLDTRAQNLDAKDALAAVVGVKGGFEVPLDELQAEFDKRRAPNPAAAFLAAEMQHKLLLERVQLGYIAADDPAVVDAKAEAEALFDPAFVKG
jgi:hypothetical protein